MIVNFINFKIVYSTGWYSSGVYYLTESLFDFIWVTLICMVSSLIMFYRTHQKDEQKRLWAFIYAFQIVMHNVDGVSHLIAIVLLNYESICLVVAVMYGLQVVFFSNAMSVYEDWPDALKPLFLINAFHWGYNAIMMSIYSFDRCPDGQQSEYLYTRDIVDEDLYLEHTSYGLTCAISIKLLALLTLLIVKNPMIFQSLMKRFQRNESNSNDMQLRIISTNITQRNDFFNEIDLTDETDEQSMTTSFRHNSESSVEIDRNEEMEPQKSLSIAWIDMTLKVDKTFYSKEKLILRSIKGFIRFGTMTALMGPSGAGKTSLLRSLNGMYRNLMTEDSKIYLSKTHKIRTCFIAQDQREHIVPGLTVKQALLYASKLKNTCSSVDHMKTINDLMDELAINDIRNINIDNCSSGQQKRIVMAMEMTSSVKPNLICVDEPTSGVDSHSALLVYQN